MRRSERMATNKRRYAGNGSNNLELKVSKTLKFVLKIKIICGNPRINIVLRPDQILIVLLL